MDDPDKIKAILAKLKSDTGSDAWEEAEGYHALLVAKFINEGVQFIGDQGSIVKLFLNTETGEMRTYYHRFVAKD